VTIETSPFDLEAPLRIRPPDIDRNLRVFPEVCETFFHEIVGDPDRIVAHEHAEPDRNDIRNTVLRSGGHGKYPDRRKGGLHFFCQFDHGDQIPVASSNIYLRVAGTVPGQTNVPVPPTPDRGEGKIERYKVFRE
jgi:hypothetical protein